MIDEELYVLATQELNSNQRREDLWARAIALASDDHDEARYLYTNLRVEELAAERRAGQVAEDIGAGDLSSREMEDTPSSVTGTKVDTSADEALKLEDLPGLDASKATDEDSEVSQIQQRVDDMMQSGLGVGNGLSNDSTLETEFGGDAAADIESASTPKNVDEAGTPRRIRNQIGIYIDDDPDAPQQIDDPLDRTEPEGFDAADNSLELTAPDNLPPVNLEPVDSTVNSIAETPESSLTDIAPTQSAEPDSVSGYMPKPELGEETIDRFEQPLQNQLKSGRAYTVLKHEDGSRRAVKIGNSWPALLFTTPWLLYKKLWGTALVYVVMAAALLFATATTGLTLLEAGTDASSAQKLVFAGFALLSLFGLLYIPFRQGNDWAARRLERKGFSRHIDLNAQSAKDALDIARN